MVFEEIVLDGFATYKGQNIIDLTTLDSQKPVILIGGENGCGKTTLLDAFQLVLFGPAARCSNRGKLPYETYLERCINRESQPDQGAKIRLRFHLNDSEGAKHFRIERAWQRKGKKVKEHFWVYQLVKNDWRYDRILSQNWGDYVEGFFPSQVAPFFFFDGEKIEALADFENSAPLIHSAIHSLLGLNLVGQLDSDLVALEKRKARELASQKEEVILDRIEQEIEALKEAHIEQKKQLDILKNKRREYETALNETDLLFRQNGGELYENRLFLEKQLAERRHRLTEQEERLRTIASGPAPLLMLRHLLENIKHQADIELTAKREEILYKTLVERDQKLITHLAELSNDVQVLAATVSFLEIDRAGRLKATEETECYLELEENGYKKLDFLLQTELRELEKTIPMELETAKLERNEIDLLESTLAGVPDESKVVEIISKRIELQQFIKEIDRDLAIQKEIIERTEHKREFKKNELRRELERAAELRFEGKDVRRILQYSAKVRHTLNGFRDKVLAKHLERIEELVLQSFKSLLRKETLIGKIKINKDTCALKIYSATGAELYPDRLSAGERQLLATALLWGICKAAGKPLPTVIDTPLGRLDTSHRTNLVNNYFPLASQQVLLLSTNEEIVGNYYNQLKPYISRTYLLSHDEHNGGTTAKQGYFC